jgi:hypothetical protein
MKMSTTILDLRRLAVSAALAAMLVLPAPSSAQSQLDTEQARAFLGSWVLAMETDMGPMTLNMTIEDRGGKVAASVGSPEMGGMMDVTDITLAEGSLVLKYDVDAQGTMIDVMMNLTPSGNDLQTYLEAAAGQFSATAVATRVTS